MQVRINTNNNGFVEIERTDYGISVTSCDEKGNVTRRDGFDEGEIIIALDLLRYMRDKNQKSAYLINESISKSLQKLFDDNLEEFKILQ